MKGPPGEAVKGDEEARSGKGCRGVATLREKASRRPWLSALSVRKCS